jgi:hypothetical protein
MINPESGLGAHFALDKRIRLKEPRQKNVMSRENGTRFYGTTVCGVHTASRLCTVERVWYSEISYGRTTLGKKDGREMNGYVQRRQALGGRRLPRCREGLR